MYFHFPHQNRNWIIQSHDPTQGPYLKEYVWCPSAAQKQETNVNWKILKWWRNTKAQISLGLVLINGPNNQLQPTGTLQTWNLHKLVSFHSSPGARNTTRIWPEFPEGTHKSELGRLRMLIRRLMNIFPIEKREKSVVEVVIWSG